MEDAVAAAAVGPERQRVAEHDPAFRQRARQARVPRRRLLRVGIGAIGFGEDHVEGNHGGALFAQPGDQLRDAIATPRPLADRRQAEVVDVDDGDAAVRRLRRNRAEQGVVGAAIDVGDEIRAEDDQRHGDERRGQAAEQHEAPALGASD